MQADDAVEDEAGRSGSRGASQSTDRTAELEARPAVQAACRAEGEAERLDEGASRRSIGKQNRTKGQSESRKLESEG